MKKRLLLVLSSISLVIGCSYYITGKYIQQNYYETVAKLNNQSNVKVNLVSYKRGLLNSDVKLELQLAANDPENSRLVSLQQRIKHGPIMITDTPKGAGIKILAGQIKTTFSGTLQDHIVQYTGQVNPVVLTTTIDFSKQAVTWLKVAGIDQKSPTDFHVAWDTIIGEWRHDLAFTNYIGDINIPSISLDSPQWNFKVANLVLAFNTSNQENNYDSNNRVSSRTLSFTRNGIELLKFDDLNASLDFSSKDNNLTMVFLAEIAKSQIVNQQFAQDTFKLQANNLNREAMQHLPTFGHVSPKSTIEFAQKLTEASTDLQLELPKHFTEAFLSYISFELYRGSLLGKYDQRPEQVVLKDVTSSITSLVQGAVKQNLFIDRGAHYALNVGTPVVPQTPTDNPQEPHQHDQDTQHG